MADFAQVYVETSPISYNQEFFLQGNGWTGDTTPLGALRIYQATVSGPVHLLANTRIGGSINGGTILGKIDGAYQLEVLATANQLHPGARPDQRPEHLRFHARHVRLDPRAEFRRHQFRAVDG